MVKSILIKLYLFQLKIWNTLRYRGVNFIMYNLRKLNSKNLKLNGIPFCEQKTFITGAGTIDIGSNCKFGYKPGGFNRNGSIEFQARYRNAKIKIGNSIFTNNNVFICAANSIQIGDKTLIGQGVVIMDFEAHGIHPDERSNVGEIGSVVIGENVWIGNNVTILKNSVIGKNSIIAAGAVVSGVFAENVIIGGVPAKIIKKLDV